MKDKIIEILKRRIVTVCNDCGFSYPVIDAEDEDLDNIAADLNAVFEERLREELIKFCHIYVPAELIGDEIIFVGEYLKSREK